MVEKFINNLHFNYSYKNLSPIFYNHEKAIPLKNPLLMSKNNELLEQLGLNFDDEILTQFLNGNFTSHYKPFALAYSGHQFGYFVPNLGDGRALNHGKIDNFHLQTKGSGVTKYSRNGDGRAVLRSTIREYLLSEAMVGLGIPTTRGVAIISSDSRVYRETDEKCAIILRASTSWVRFGTFEFASLQRKVELVKELADYVIDESYPYLTNKINKYEELFFAIVDRYVELIALWQSVGFMHGVMNTDNMSIEGLTLDYGPYAFMEEFSRGYICNHSDHEGRYSFENQPFIAQWNLLVLANSFKKIANFELLESYLNQFIGRFKIRYFEIIASKLGLATQEKEDMRLMADMFHMIEECTIDYSVFFYYLSCENFDSILTISSNQNRTKDWLVRYKKRVENEPVAKEERLTTMRKINPKYILKNYILQDVIKDAENGDFKLLNDILEIAKNPYAEHPKYEKYSLATPKDLGGFICSCSS